MSLGIGIGVSAVLMTSTSGAAYQADFSNASLPPGLTFSRASSGSYIGITGLLTTAAADTPRFDYDPATARTNYIRNSTAQGAAAGSPGTIPTNWSMPAAQNGIARQISLLGTTTVSGQTVDLIGIRYSGTATATTDLQLFFDTATGIAASDGQTWTPSVYAQLSAGSTSGLSFINLQMFAYNASQGFVSTYSSKNLIANGLNGTLRRFDQPATLSGATIAGVRESLVTRVQNGMAVDFTLVVGAPQMNLGALTAYVPTNGAIATQCDIRGLLIEEQRTNIALYSNTLSNAAWGKTNSSITDGQATGPDGTQSLALWQRGSTAAAFTRQDVTKAGSAITYTGSFHVRAGTGTFFAVRLQGTLPALADAVVNLSTGTFSTAPTASSGFTGASGKIEAMGGGLFRVSLTATSDTATLISLGGSFSQNGVVVDGTDTVANSTGYVGFAQLEQGGDARSYIGTTNAAVSRAADQLFTGILPWFSPGQGTLISNFIPPNGSPATNRSIAFFCDGTTNNRIGHYQVSASTQIASRIVTGGVSTSPANNGILQVGQVNKLALSYGNGGASSCLNGGSVTTASGVTTPAAGVIDRLNLGVSENRGANWLNGWLRSFTYYNPRLSDAQLQSMTT